VTIITDPRCTEYHLAGHPEKPSRVSRSVDLLRNQKAIQLEWAEPIEVTDEILLRAHTRDHLNRLLVEEDFDGDTAWHPKIHEHARRGVGGALAALAKARSGNTAFSLMRPPGHHATRHHAMGFCYLSNMAIAVLEAKAQGIERVAVFDFDVHHGNGTEDILSGVRGTTFISTHQFPCYPGTGVEDVGGNCFNFRVAPMSPRDVWRATLSRALDRLKASKPELVGVSAGFDAFSGDPLAQGTLEREDFHWIGQQLRALGIPLFSVLEGGYSVDLPDLILHYLSGLNGRPL
jgi:acetoin utilization deacetylase AcuC-like enzyme